MERKIQSMKKERNKQRAENQRRNPTAKRRRLDEDNEYKEVRNIFKTVMSEENCKRKAEEHAPEKQANLKRQKTDIRDYLRPNSERKYEQVRMDPLGGERNSDEAQSETGGRIVTIEASRAEHQSNTTAEREKMPSQRPS